MLCCDCNKNFSSLKCLKAHIVKFHQNKKWECDDCGREFASKSLLRKHFIQKNVCRYCKTKYANRQSLSKHQKNCDFMYVKSLRALNSPSILCRSCDRFVLKSFLHNHYKSFEHRDKLSRFIKESDKIQLFHSSFNGNYKVFRIKIDDELDVSAAFDENSKELLALIKQKLLKDNAIKFRIGFTGLYQRTLEKDEIFDSIKTFESSYKSLYIGSEVNEVFNEAKSELLETSQTKEFEHSGWTITSLLQINLELLKIKSHVGGSYLPLYGILSKNKHNLLNIKSEDYQCIVDCVLAYFFRDCTKAPDNPRSYDHLRHKVNIKGLKFPLAFKELSKFIKMNSNLNFSLNVYSFNGERKFGIILTTKEEKKNHIDLLAVTRKNFFHHHYVLITNFTALFKSSFSKHFIKQLFVCKACLSHFKSEKDLDFHKSINCNSHQTVLTFKNKFVEFRNFSNLQFGDIYFMCDIECLLQKNDSSNNVLNSHKPCLVVYKPFTITGDEDFCEMRVSHGENCVEEFLSQLIIDIQLYYDRYLLFNHPATPITSETLKTYKKLEEQTICFICKNSMSSSENLVLDHCHLVAKNDKKYSFNPPLIGKTNWRGIVHSNCNILFRKRTNFYVGFWNGSRYDFLFILRALLKNKELRKTLHVIPKTLNEFLSISFSFYHRERKIKVVFNDPYLHCLSSVKTAIESQSDITELENFFQSILSSKDISVKNITKLPFPYELLTDFENLYKQREFPSKKDFFNTLSGLEIDDDAYIFANRIWNELKCSSLFDFLSIYCKVDVIAQHICFLNYRKLIFSKFQLDPIFYITISQLSYDILFRYSNLKLEVINDASILSILLGEIRAGLCYSTVHSVSANNELLENFNSSLPSKSILALDIVGK